MHMWLRMDSITRVPGGSRKQQNQGACERALKTVRLFVSISPTEPQTVFTTGRSLLRLDTVMTWSFAALVVIC